MIINQLRDKTVGELFGDLEERTDGRALKYNETLSISLKKVKTDVDGKRLKGSRIKALVAKNSFGRPFRHTDFTVSYDGGVINNLQHFIEACVHLKLMGHEDSNYSIYIAAEDQNLEFNSMEEVTHYLSNNEAFYKELLNKFSGVVADLDI